MAAKRSRKAGRTVSRPGAAGRHTARAGRAAPGKAAVPVALALTVTAVSAAAATPGRAPDAAAAGARAGGTTPASGTGDPFAAFRTQHLDWHACQTGPDDPDDTDGAALDAAGAQCADVAVPLDYAHPSGRTITLAVSRLRATDTAHRIGALVINLGGPATPDLTTGLLARQGLATATARYDLIGTDPRFTGRSTPLDCHWPEGWLTRSAGVDRAGFERTVRRDATFTADCVRQHGDVLPHVSTADTARDMDLLRSVLGESKLNYLGYSYGSYLGALYTQLFPDRAGRIVLDSSIDPNRPGTLAHPEGAAPREAALREWAAWAAEHDDRYHLGGTAAQVLATVYGVYRQAARHPLHVGPYRVDDSVIGSVLIDPLSNDDEQDDAQVAADIQVLVTAAATGSAQPGSQLAGALAGQLTGQESARHSAQTAIMCADANVPADPGHYWRDIQAHRADEPLFGPMTRDITPCAFWPGNGHHPTVHVGNDVPALLVGATGDINAVWPMQQAMHRALTGSRMITLTGVRTHGVYGFWGSSCVDRQVNSYLDSGQLPAADVTCGRDQG